MIIPVHNGARYLAEAIRSVLAQELPAQEILVVDDGSTDDSAGVAARFGNPVRVLRQTQQGPGAARNAGARQAAGEFLAFLDADDLWHPAKLALQVAAFDAIPGLAVASTHVQNFHSPDLTEAQRERILCPPGAMPGMIPSALLVRSTCFFPFPENLRAGELIPWLGRARDLQLKIHVLPEVLVNRRLHETNLGHKGPRGYLAAVKEMLDRRRSGSA